MFYFSLSVVENYSIYDINNPDDFPKYISDKDIIESENALISLNGYLCIVDGNDVEEVAINNQESVYKYKNERFFNPCECSWNVNGNLVFKSKDLLNWVDKYN